MTDGKNVKGEIFLSLLGDTLWSIRQQNTMDGYVVVSIMCDLPDLYICAAEDAAADSDDPRSLNQKDTQTTDALRRERRRKAFENEGIQLVTLDEILEEVDKRGNGTDPADSEDIAIINVDESSGATDAIVGGMLADMLPNLEYVGDSKFTQWALIGSVREKREAMLDTLYRMNDLKVSVPSEATGQTVNLLITLSYAKAVYETYGVVMLPGVASNPGAERETVHKLNEYASSGDAGELTTEYTRLVTKVLAELTAKAEKSCGDVLADMTFYPLMQHNDGTYQETYEVTAYHIQPQKDKTCYMT